jgi:YD repeat-containing protein
MKQFVKINLLLLITITFNTSFGQHLNGKIKSYKTTYFLTHESYGRIKKAGKLNDSTFFDQLAMFDEAGRMANMIEYNADGTVHCRYNIRTDYNDNMMESMYLRFVPKTVIDRKPFLIESVKYSWGEMCEMVYKNDSTGLPAEETVYDLMGHEIFKSTIKRDQKGNALEYRFSDGTVEKYKYDAAGNRTEKVSVGPNGTITTISRYDAMGNVIEEDIRDSFASYYKFHDDHNLYTYKYDKQGNWTERVEYEHDIPLRIAVRTIEYAE